MSQSAMLPSVCGSQYYSTIAAWPVLTSNSSRLPLGVWQTELWLWLPALILSLSLSTVYFLSRFVSCPAPVPLFLSPLLHFLHPTSVANWPALKGKQTTSWCLLFILNHNLITVSVIRRCLSGFTLAWEDLVLDDICMHKEVKLNIGLRQQEV